jgi:hypothetical protein
VTEEGVVDVSMLLLLLLSKEVVANRWPHREHLSRRIESHPGNHFTYDMRGKNAPDPLGR